MDTVTRLKYVSDDRESIALLSGYLRKIASSIPPQIIIDLCLIYYAVIEYFFKCGDSMAISSKKSKNDYVYKVGDVSCGDNTVYGAYIIDGRATPNTIFKWKFHIHSVDQLTSIGIESSTNFRNLNTGFTYPRHDKPKIFYYAYGPCINSLQSRIETSGGLRANPSYSSLNPYQQTDLVISMELNCKEKTLSYIVDGDNLGIAFDNVELINRKYRWVISLSLGTLKYSHDTGFNNAFFVQLLDFQMQIV